MLTRYEPARPRSRTGDFQPTSQADCQTGTHTCARAAPGRSRSTGCTDVYASLTGKTLHNHATAISFRPNNFDLPTEDQRLTPGLKANLPQGIAVIHDGPHFINLFPEKQRAFLTTTCASRPEIAVMKSGFYPSGTINFRRESGAVLSIYPPCPADAPAPVRVTSGVVRLKTTCPPTRDEALYAISTVLALNGVTAPARTAKIHPGRAMVQRNMVVARAPKPDPPQSPGSQQVRPQARCLGSLLGNRGIERWRKALYDSFTTRFCRLLLNVCWRSMPVWPAKAEPSNQFDGMPIWFHIDTPLTKSELIRHRNHIYAELAGIVR